MRKHSRPWTSRVIALAAAAAAAAGMAGGVPAALAAEEETVILLSDSGVQVDGTAASTDPGAAVYPGADIIYYRDGTDETYGEGTEGEKHAPEEAAAHTVVTITRPGTYRLSGTLSKGQIFVDLGEDAKTDPEAAVTLILDNVDITCTVAPAVFFYRVYECDQAWVAYDEGESESYSPSGAVDTSAAGANVVLAAGSENTVTGSHVARIYKEGTTKKLHKYDGAFYSRMSMNMNGDGTGGSGALTIIADNEGLDAELHLTINGGVISIEAQDDGINTNEDGISVTTVNGGHLTVSGGLGAEGDGIDSNGYLTINGGTVWTMSNERSPDGGIDADSDITINGGNVYAFGTRNDAVAASSAQPYLELFFASTLPAGTEIQITDAAGNQKMAFSLERACQSMTLSLDAYSRPFVDGETYCVYVNGVQQQYTGSRSGGMGGPRPDGIEPPEGMEPPEDFQGGRPGGPGPGQEGQPPEGMTPPQRRSALRGMDGP